MPLCGYCGLFSINYFRKKKNYFRKKNNKLLLPKNVDTAITPQRLQHAAGAAAHSGDLRMQVSVPGHAKHAIRFWDELRTWDPGD
jgi:hypothetical protein